MSRWGGVFLRSAVMENHWVVEQYRGYQIVKVVDGEVPAFCVRKIGTAGLTKRFQSIPQCKRQIDTYCLLRATYARWVAETPE